MNRKASIRIAFNAPAILTFTAICLAAYGLSVFTGGTSNRLIFGVYRSSLRDPLTYLRFLTHIFGHTSWDHLVGNLTMILLLGPLLEEKYGSPFIVKVILITAISTGLVHFILKPGVMLLGASGVVFALILLSSITGGRDHEIPLTFLVIAVIYIGSQVYDGVFIRDNVSNLTHIIGGIVGAAAGFFLRK